LLIHRKTQQRKKKGERKREKGKEEKRFAIYNSKKWKKVGCSN